MYLEVVGRQLIVGGWAGIRGRSPHPGELSEPQGCGPKPPCFMQGEDPGSRSLQREQDASTFVAGSVQGPDGPTPGRSAQRFKRTDPRKERRGLPRSGKAHPLGRFAFRGVEPCSGGSLGPQLVPPPRRLDERRPVTAQAEATRVPGRLRSGGLAIDTRRAQMETGFAHVAQAAKKRGMERARTATKTPGARGARNRPEGTRPASCYAAMRVREQAAQQPSGRVPRREVSGKEPGCRYFQGRPAHTAAHQRDRVKSEGRLRSSSVPAQMTRVFVLFRGETLRDGRNGWSSG